MWSAIVVPLISFTVATLAAGWLARTRGTPLAIDEPNARSLHTSPVPRSGGIGLLSGILAGWLVIGSSLPPAFWVAAAAVVAVSLLDDLRELSIAVRLATHLFAASLVVAEVINLESPLLLFASILAIAWMCNLYNFMDGSDGLAGGMALFGFLSYAAAAWFAGSTQFALLNLAVSASAAGFLVHNFHPARIFLGDAGSVPLGFLAATMGLIGWQQHDWTWWFPLLVFSPFIVDASVTLFRRFLTGARIWEAHRDHYYQRLVLLGLGHRNTALAEYTLMIVCVLTGLWGMTLSLDGQYALLATAGLIYLLLIAAVELAWSKRLA